MVFIKYEVIVKYNSDIKLIEDKLDALVDVLSDSYAIITLKNKEDISKLKNFPEIEYIEKIFKLVNQDEKKFSKSKQNFLIKAKDYDIITLKNKNLNRQINLNKDIANSILVSHDDNFIEELKDLNTTYEIIRLSNSRTLMFFDSLSRRNIELILRLNSVQIIENVVKVTPLGTITRGIENGISGQEEIGVNFFKNNPNIQLTGRGTIIAVIDTGIDYLHKDFIYPDGTSKIRYIWDQSVEGKPPEGFFLGTEYTNEDINNAIKENNKNLSTDEEGHGTIISGICAGLGTGNKSYEGIAPGAELIVIKLAKVNGDYNSAMLFAALQYAYRKGEELNIPTSIQVSMGSNGLAGYANRTNSRETYFSNGVCVVTGAGNEGDTGTHASGRILRDGEIVDIDIQIQQEEPNLRIEVWLSRPDRVNIFIISPTGETTKAVDLSSYDLVTGKFDFEDTEYSIRYSYPATYSGQEHTIIYLRRAKPGIWKLQLEGAYITGGVYNVYLQNRVFLKEGTRFRESDPNSTINYPGVQPDVITVGTYNSITRSIWASSSRGPSLTNRIKPDVVAPGVNIIGPYLNNSYATVTGSSVAAAHVSASIALYLEYIINEDNYPNKGFVQIIRTFIQGGANRAGNVVYPNNIWGYGVFNFRGMFDQLK
ncbi:S8 family serine peptidase [Paraclostridium sordellii]|uniref:S8 family serine peptidase n=1 Tax=Paraclostridium sordellii TaxID=1505 RepID=UPI001C615CA1|nr:S8 family serine peptidase [Paeniclostridium sordellii]QYE99170.1 S8 family serine peptidase [Paeniclostridium sordellii]